MMFAHSVLMSTFRADFTRSWWLTRMIAMKTKLVASDADST
jgi:hypothetical protein